MYRKTTSQSILKYWIRIELCSDFRISGQLKMLPHEEGKKEKKRTDFYFSSLVDQYLLGLIQFL